MKREPTSTTDKEDRIATILGLCIAIGPLTAAIVLVQLYVPTFPVGFILSPLLMFLLGAQVLTALKVIYNERKWRKQGWKP